MTPRLTLNLKRLIPAISALLLLLPVVGVTQTHGLIPGETRVRIRVDDPGSIGVTRGSPRSVDPRHVVVGTFQGQSGGRLIVRDADQDAEFTIPIENVRRFDLSLGTHSRAGRGALIGFLAGGIGGAVSGVILCASEGCETSGLDNETFWVSGFLAAGGAVAGLGLGALTGALIRTETWKASSVGSLGLDIRPGPGGEARFGLAFSIPIER